MSTRSAARIPWTPPALPIERYRGIAAVLLAGLLVIAAVAPLRPRALPPEALTPPSFDGQPAATLAGALFDYPADTQLVAPDPPPRATLLREPGLTTAALRTLAGDLLTEDTGPSDTNPTPSEAHPTRDALLSGGPDRWSNLEQFMSSANNRWATNGLGVIEALRATASEGADRDTHERKALYLIGLATFAGQLTPAYFYNWGILQLMLGHNGQAAAAFNALIPFEADQPAIRYYAAVALLRSGEPDAAARLFAAVAGGPAGEWTAAAAEGHADALAAGGHTQDADAGYAALLAPGGQIDWGIYEKLLRLRLGASGADRALATVSDLAARFPDEARLQYDRGRLLLLLGRAGAATDALRAAVALRPDDPALHAGLATALVTTGDARKALPDAEAALRAMNLDPNAADLTLTYSKLDNSSLYQRSVGQAALAANLARQAALAALGQTDRARALAGSVEGQGAGADAAKAGWFRYYAGLLYGAAGFKNEAITRLTPIENVGAAIVVLHNVVPGPGRGALLLARVGLLTPAEVRDQSAALVAAGGGANGQPALAPDAATATAYYEIGRKLELAGAAPAAAPFYRAAAAWETGQDTNAGLPPLTAAGDARAVRFRAAEADYLRRQAPTDPLTATRYAQILAVAPGLTGAYANRGLLFAQTGQESRAAAEFGRAVALDPQNARAAHNAGALALRQGPGGLVEAVTQLAAARRAGGAEAASWGPDLVGAPSTLGLPDTAPANDFGGRLSALITLLLLLAHTIIPGRWTTAPPTGGGVLAGLGERLQAPLAGPAVYLVAGLVATLAWAWAFAANSPLVALALAPLTLMAALLALGAPLAGRMLVAGRERHPGIVRVTLWPLGLLLSVLGAPLGVVYGRLLTARAAAQGATASAARSDAGYETLGEPAPARGARPAGAEDLAVWHGWGALGPAARVALAALLTNAALAVICAALYSQLGDPVTRTLLVTNVAVLAFTGVSDPEADGWRVWRRSPLLWMLLFVAAAAALTALLLGAV